MIILDFSLVDPDNRRPVDYARRARLLTALRRTALADPAFARALLEDLNDGRAKLYVTWRALQFRKAHAALFATRRLSAGGRDRRAARSTCAPMRATTAARVHW
jgi:maltooligosyltrehalose synthase